MRLWVKLLVIIEIIFFFGPCFLLFIYFPLGFVLALSAGTDVLLVYLLMYLGSAFGLFVAFNLAARIFDDTQKLPSYRVIIAGIVSGVAASTGAMAMVSFNMVLISIFILPIVGVVHFLWLCRNEFTPID